MIEVWEEAKPYQDKRGDSGHALSVFNSSMNLCRYYPDANRTVISLVDFLHDTGYSQVEKELLKKFIAKELSPDEEKAIRIFHEQKGVEIAGMILTKVGYEDSIIKRVQYLIEGHDTNKEKFRGDLEGEIFKDGDTLWWFTKRNFIKEAKAWRWTREEIFTYFSKHFEEPDLFFTPEAREIARTELALRFTED